MVYYEMKKIFSKTSGRIAVICLIGLLIVVCGFAVSGVSYMNEQGEKENGVAAVRKLREAKKEWSGPLTEEKIGEVIAANLAVNNTEEYRSGISVSQILPLAGNRASPISVCFWFMPMGHSGIMIIIGRIPLCRKMRKPFMPTGQLI